MPLNLPNKAEKSPPTPTSFRENTLSTILKNHRKLTKPCLTVPKRDVNVHCGPIKVKFNKMTNLLIEIRF